MHPGRSSSGGQGQARVTVPAAGLVTPAGRAGRAGAGTCLSHAVAVNLRVGLRVGLSGLPVSVRLGLGFNLQLVCGAGPIQVSSSDGRPTRTLPLTRRGPEQMANMIRIV